MADHDLAIHHFGGQFSSLRKECRALIILDCLFEEGCWEAMNNNYLPENHPPTFDATPTTGYFIFKKTGISQDGKYRICTNLNCQCYKVIFALGLLFQVSSWFQFFGLSCLIFRNHTFSMEGSCSDACNGCAEIRDVLLGSDIPAKNDVAMALACLFNQIWSPIGIQSYSQMIGVAWYLGSITILRRWLDPRELHYSYMYILGCSTLSEGGK